MADLRIDIASEFTGKKAFNQAGSATASLERGVKKLGTSLAVAFSTRQLYSFAKAFAADDKAAKVLSRSLNNLGLSFADPQVKTFIANLETTYGVLDDKLRPAFQRLLTTTGSVTQSQDLLITALDLSAASGQDVVSVAGDLSKAYVGQTRALAKYGLGLSQAQLKAMSFEEIQAKVNKLFGGQAKVAADSYAGSLDKISVAAQQAKEIIGQGLVQALGDASGTGGLAASLAGIIKLATIVSDLFIGIGRTFAAISGAGFATTGVSPLQAIKNFKKITAEFRRQDEEAARKQSMVSLNYGGLTGFQKQYAEAQAKKKQAELLKLAKEQLKVAKEQTALQKAGTLFDLQQTQIIAALKGDISAEERKRLELQLAILTQNESAASKLAGELAKSQGLSQSLVAYYSNLPDAKNPFSGWITTLLNAQQLAASIANGNYSQASMTSAASGYGVTGTQYSLPNGSQFMTDTGLSVTVNVNAGSVIAEEGLKDVIRDSLLNDSLQAKFASIYRQGGLGAFG
jgi:hypothetical protein